VICHGTGPGGNSSVLLIVEAKVEIGHKASFRESSREPFSEAE
jgi:hypothetical protein